MCENWSRSHAEQLLGLATRQEHKYAEYKRIDLGVYLEFQSGSCSGISKNPKFLNIKKKSFFFELLVKKKRI